MMDRTHDIEGEVFMLPALLSGRNTPAYSGCRPLHKIHDNYLTCAQHEYIGVTKIESGEKAIAKLWFITPEVYPNCLWCGREIEIEDGIKVIGKLRVTKIINKSLEVLPEKFNPVWVEPQNLSYGVSTNG